MNIKLSELQPDAAAQRMKQRYLHLNGSTVRLIVDTRQLSHATFPQNGKEVITTKTSFIRSGSIDCFMTCLQWWHEALFR